MSYRNWRDWIEKALLAFCEQESDEKWLRIGIRTYALLILWGVALLSGTALENAITGDVSLIPRLAWFAYFVCVIPGVLFGTVCLVTGLIRRYILKKAL